MSDFNLYNIEYGITKFDNIFIGSSTRRTLSTTRTAFVYFSLWIAPNVEYRLRTYAITSYEGENNTLTIINNILATTLATSNIEEKNDTLVNLFTMLSDKQE